MGTLLGRVLVIDDDPFMLKVISDLLERAGYRVLAQSSALGLTQVLVRERIDAAVIDWNLPTLQGDDVIRLLRTWDEMKELPVLLVTGAPEETRARLGEQLPGIRILGKSALREELVPALGGVLGSGKTVRGLSPVQIGARGEFISAPQRPKSRDLVAELMTQIADTMPIAGSVWSEASRGRVSGVAALTDTLDLLAGQAQLLALEEASLLLEAMAGTLRAVPAGCKVPREVRRAVERGLAALAALPGQDPGALAMAPEPVHAALHQARAELHALAGEHA